MPLARLAGLVASMPSWVALIITRTNSNLTPPPGQNQYQQPATDKLAEVHDGNVAKAREALARTTDDYLWSTSWRLIAGGKVVMEQPRHVVLRETLMHLAHHRGRPQAAEGCLAAHGPKTRSAFSSTVRSRPRTPPRAAPPRGARCASAFRRLLRPAAHGLRR